MSKEKQTLPDYLLAIIGIVSGTVIPFATIYFLSLPWKEQIYPLFFKENATPPMSSPSYQSPSEDVATEEASNQLLIDDKPIVLHSEPGLRLYNFFHTYMVCTTLANRGILGEYGDDNPPYPVISQGEFLSVGDLDDLELSEGDLACQYIREK